MSGTVTASGVGGQIEVNGEWVTIRRKGALAKATHGLSGDKRIPMSSILSVQFKPATRLTNGFLQLAVAGGIENGRGAVGAAQDENTVMFRKGQAEDFDRVRDHLEHRIASRNAVPAGEPGSVADELGKLVDLRQSGALSEEEFAEQKARLLNRRV